ncbi:ATP-dependent helicase HrpB [Actinophytocola xinjiangensis]|uniref:ATP-dependent helicase HrpB n=1 Tax=Actinophytocola xinjiangensis TaxID=485602 RepID=A0A7Z0WRN8_9PSEU|nr:ATP-dependent helicase HrpB [Actinophytocola xinjiangensis]OLF13095.1 ATP-dependent helicase HrpB [Actinophytocola xinjiangensis]
MPDLPDLPVRAVLDELLAALTGHGAAVLVAPPGTGKTTVVPLALAKAWPRGRVVVAEPRRLAARAAAARMASLLGEQVGDTVGYAVRGDRKVSRATRIEVVTTGLLVRRLQHDPSLPGVSTVLLDECHERHLDADLLLTLALDARAGLRPDLRLLATSATVATDRLVGLLGEGTPVVRATVRTHPVTTVHVPPLRGERVEACVARATRRALSEGDGDVLVFLPGAGEIARTAALLGDVPVVPLHGRLPTARQDAALRPGDGQRVVLATAVAESSLTVPGVRAVVDAGLARVSRMDHRRGLAGLVTTRVSASVAEQRAGRAGREAPGRVYRCWPEHEHPTLPAQPDPEIRTTDLTRLALELACWGTPDGAGLDWWDPPPPGALAAGRAVLTTLGAVTADGVTDRGRRLAELGLHPRLARALLDGADAVGPRTAADVVALLDDDTLAPHPDVSDALRALRAGHPNTDRWRREARRLTRQLDATTPASRPASGDVAWVVALAFPEWLARRRSPGSRTYLMVGGTAADLDGAADAEWLAIARADRRPGHTEGRIRLAARADQRLAETVGATMLSTVDEVAWAEDVVARRITRLGAIVLTDRPLRDPDPAAVRAALTEGLHATNLTLLRWTDTATRLRDRLALLHRAIGDPWPDVTDPALLDRLDDWLGPELATARRRADLAATDTRAALSRLLPWPAASRLDELAPERLRVPSGAHHRVDYSADEPVLPVKVQEAFGWTTTPTVADGRIPVLLHLLSPAGRPVAVTRDLPSFWRDGYHQVRAELRGRYPKHPWPTDPTTATPTARTNRTTR